MRFYVSKARPTISCIKCGLTTEAGPQSIDMWCHSVSDVHRFMEGTMPDIPVGWSSNGWKGNRRDLRCTQCTGPT